MTDPVDRVQDSAQARDLRTIRELFGERITASRLKGIVRGFQSQRGIYKPAGSGYALWVRETKAGPYEDRPVEYHSDGSWSYLYSPEYRSGRADLSLPTNAGLLRCRHDRVPVGVFRQVAGPSGATWYEVLGLAYVEEFDGSHFVLRGEPIDWTEPPTTTTETRVFVPFEREEPSLTAALRLTRDRRFGEVVRRVYKGRCSLCNLGYQLRGLPVGTEAAHIIPVESRGVIGDVRNGLLLCRNHHDLFDRNAWTFDEDLRVTVAPDEGFKASARANHILDWEGRRLPNLPELAEDLPAPEAIRWRLDVFHRLWG